MNTPDPGLIVLSPDLLWKLVSALAVVVAGIATVWASWKKSAFQSLKDQVDSWEGLAQVRKAEAEWLRIELEKITKRLNWIEEEHHQLRKQHQELQQLNIELQRTNIDLRNRIGELQDRSRQLEALLNCRSS